MAKLTFSQSLANVLDRMNPASMVGKLGQSVKDLFDRVSYVEGVVYNVTNDHATAKSLVLSTENAVIIQNVMVRCTATNAAGTITIQDSAGVAITDAMACATVNLVARNASLDGTKITIPAGGSIKIKANGAADRAQVTIFLVEM